MRFAYGATRWVILTPRYAIKFARVRPLRPILQLVRHFVKGEVKQRLQQFDANPIKGGMKYLAAGIRANLTERRIYRDHQSDILAPTLWTFFGLVNLQVRGEQVSTQEHQAHYLTNAFKEAPIDNNDLVHPRQFCKINGSVVLADYGRDDLVPVLAAYRNEKSPA